MTNKFNIGDYVTVIMNMHVPSGHLKLARGIVIEYGIRAGKEPFNSDPGKQIILEYEYNVYLQRTNKIVLVPEYDILAISKMSS